MTAEAEPEAGTGATDLAYCSFVLIDISVPPTPDFSDPYEKLFV